MTGKQAKTRPLSKPLWLSALLMALPALAQTQSSNWEKSVIDDLMEFQDKNRYSSRIIEPLLVKYGPCYLDTEISFIVKNGQPSDIKVSTPIPHETLVKYWNYLIPAAAPYPMGSGQVSFTARVEAQRYDRKERPTKPCGKAL